MIFSDDKHSKMSKQLPTAASDKIFKLAMQYKNITIEG